MPWNTPGNNNEDPWNRNSKNQGPPDLDEVFQIGNIGPEEKIERLNRMHSISVGDVISNVYCECYVVKDFGFERFERKKKKEKFERQLYKEKDKKMSSV